MRAAIGVTSRSRAIAAAVLVIAAAIRSLELGLQPLWWDEGWSVYFASLPVADMLEATAADIHPPLYYLVLHGWTAAFGFSPVALRSLSVTAGLVVVLAGWRLGHRLFGPRVGLVAAFLLALSPLQVFYAQEARMYSLVTALGLLSWLALVESDVSAAHIQDASQIRKLWLAAYVLSATLALYAEYYAVLLWLGQAAYVVVACWREPAARPRRLAPLAVPPLLFVPWLAFAAPRLLQYVTEKQAIEGYRALGPLAFAWDHLSAFASGHVLSPDLTALAIPSSLAFGALALVGWRRPRGQPAPSTVLAAYGLLPLGVGYLLHLLFPFTPRFYERILLPFSPPLYLAAAGGLTQLARGGTRWRAARSALAATAALLPTLNLLPLWTVPRTQGSDYRPLFDIIRRSGSARDVILCVHPWQYGYAIAYLPPRLRHPVLVPTDPWADPDIRARSLAELLAGSRILWFPSHESLGRILESDIAADLNRTAAQAYAGWLDGETLLLAYAEAGSQLAQGASGAIRDGPVLARSSLSRQAQAGSGTVMVELDWAPTAPLGGVEASLRLVDHLGRVWASQDFVPTYARQRRALLVPWGTPATALSLALTISRDGIELEPESSRPGDRSLVLGTVQITPSEEPPPPLSDLGAQPLDVPFAEAIVLRGRGDWPTFVPQGGELPIDLWWTAIGPVEREPVLFVQALSRDGRVIAAAERRITNGLWPPTHWPSGVLVRDPQPLLFPADAPSGQLTLVAGLLDPESRQRLPAGSSDVVMLGELEVVAVERDFRAPKMPNATSVAFGDLATLVGFELTPCPDLSPECLAGHDEMEVRLAWRAERTTGTRYRSFVHLTCDEEIRAQSDLEPGAQPTTAWLPGQYVDDRHRLLLGGVGTCPVGLKIQVGLYDPVTGTRLEPASMAAEQGKLPLESRGQ
ncbi:MAG: hypothetical protein HPY83_01605 [Anaerolineae bacterium]|nr:hypothetical protein [Anaerolineae bacterium]